MGFNRSQLAGVNQHYRHASYEMYLDSMVSCGIKNLEMWCGAPHFLLDSDGYGDCRKLLAAAKARNLRYVSLTAPNMQWQYQMAASNPEQRAKSLRYFQNGVHVAAELGCRVMVVCSGWGNWDEPRDAAFARAVEMVASVADTAQEDGIILALESLQPIESNLVVTLADAVRFHRMVNHPALKLMIDTVAVRVAGETPAQWFAAFGSDIVHCHFIDGAPSGHCAWGDGESSLTETLEAFARYNYQGYYTVELGGRYLNDPFGAEHRNMETLKRYFDGPFVMAMNETEQLYICNSPH